MLLLLCSLRGSSLFAAETEKEWYSGPKIGLSLFSGILGWEVQYNHLGFDIGLPGMGGIRYYFRPYRHSWFAGIFGTGYGYDHDETKDGIAYTHYSTIEGGAGAGYRWFWRSRWSLELGLSVGYGEDRWTSAHDWRTDRFVNFAPIAAAGFSF